MPHADLCVCVTIGQIYFLAGFICRICGIQPTRIWLVSLGLVVWGFCCLLWLPSVYFVSNWLKETGRKLQRDCFRKRLLREYVAFYVGVITLFNSREIIGVSFRTHRTQDFTDC